MEHPFIECSGFGHRPLTHRMRYPMISLNSMSKSHAYNEQERLAKGSRNRGYNICNLVRSQRPDIR